MHLNTLFTKASPTHQPPWLTPHNLTAEAEPSQGVQKTHIFHVCQQMTLGRKESPHQEHSTNQLQEEGLKHGAWYSDYDT